MGAALTVARDAIQKRYGAEGFNIGMNVGPAAGQTVFHLHIHVIPRYRGDVADPRRGIRHVIPDGQTIFSIRLGSSSTIFPPPPTTLYVVATTLCCPT
jgi:diadenosine tetraphosphate (Ap4A) HIT family hydrolase